MSSKIWQYPIVFDDIKLYKLQFYFLEILFQHVILNIIVRIFIWH